MRATATMTLAIALVAASCTSSPVETGPPSSPPPNTSAPTVTTDPATASPAAMASPTAVSARVTFDGKRCEYTGPTVIPFPADLTLEFAPDSAVKDAWVGITAIKSHTTQAQLDDPANPDVGAGTPSFVYLASHMFSGGAGKSEYRSVQTGLNPLADPTAVDGHPYDTYLVMCMPSMPGRPAGGFTILHVVAPEGSPAASATP